MFYNFTILHAMAVLCSKSTILNDIMIFVQVMSDFIWKKWEWKNEKSTNFKDHPLYIEYILVNHNRFIVATLT